MRTVGDHVLIERVEKPRSKIIIGEMRPDRQVPQYGRVLAVGPGRVTRKGVRIPLDIEVGDQVIFQTYVGTEVEDDDSLLLLREEFILGVVDDE